MNIRIITLVLLLATLPVSAQKKKTVVNDSNTPLHLLQPAYQGTYGDLTPGTQMVMELSMTATAP